MKKLKKITAGLLLAFIVAANLAPMAVKASGSSIIENTPATGSLKITKRYLAEEYQVYRGVTYVPMKDAGFTLYRVMELTPGQEEGEYASFEIAEHYKEKLTVTPDALGNYNASQIEALANDLLPLTVSDPNKVIMDPTDKDGVTIKDELLLGYYLVVETDVPPGSVACKPFFAAIPSTDNYSGNVIREGKSWVYDIEAEPKNDILKLNKWITNMNINHENGITGGQRSETDTVAEGDIVKYEVTATVPRYQDVYFLGDKKPVFIIKDTMPDGLAIVDSDSQPFAPIEIKVGTTTLTLGTDYNITTLKNNQGTDPDLVITFTESFLKTKAYQNEEVKVSYGAKVTSAAVIGFKGNWNKVVADYTRNPGDENASSLPERSRAVFTYKLQIMKTQEGRTEALGGAVFELYKAGTDGKLTGDAISTKTTGNDGMLSFDRLDTGVYYLKEIQSPRGYTLLTKPIKVEIQAVTDVVSQPNGEIEFYVEGENVTDTAPKDESGQFQSWVDVRGGSATVTIENKRGFTLPSTGGIGLIIYIIIGLAGIIGISVLYCTMNHRRHKEL